MGSMQARASSSTVRYAAEPTVGDPHASPPLARLASAISSARVFTFSSGLATGRFGAEAIEPMAVKSRCTS